MTLSACKPFHAFVAILYVCVPGLSVKARATLWYDPATTVCLQENSPDEALSA